MKRIFVPFAMAIVLMSPVFISCSGAVEKTTDVVAEETAVVDAPAEFDYKGIEDLTEKEKNQFTSADVDFIIDQAEILMDRVKDMSKDEYKAYQKSLSKQETNSIVAIAMMMQGAKGLKCTTPSQLQRINEIEAFNPGEK